MAHEVLEKEIEKLKYEVDTLCVKFTRSAHSKSGTILKQLSEKRAVLSEKKMILARMKLEDAYKQLQSENASLRARLEKAVELRCNVGDKVYIADGWGERVQEFKVRKIGIFVDGLVLYYQGEYEQPITPDIWGKTVFLTEAEAQAKLEEMKGGAE